MLKKIAIPSEKIKDKTFYNLYDMPSYNDLLNQQQEFIKWLEEERERCLTFYCRTECAYAYDAFTDVLAKYKEMIGVSNDKK